VNSPEPRTPPPRPARRPSCPRSEEAGAHALQRWGKAGCCWVHDATPHSCRQRAAQLERLPQMCRRVALFRGGMSNSCFAPLASLIAVHWRAVSSGRVARTYLTLLTSCLAARSPGTARASFLPSSRSSEFSLCILFIHSHFQSNIMGFWGFGVLGFWAVTIKLKNNEK
jgi:hypothetical protein